MSTDSYRKCAKCGTTPIQDCMMSFHRFPKPGKTNVARSRAWAMFCWPETDWSGSVEALTQLFRSNKVLCNRHFQDTCFTDSTKKTLDRFSIPTLIDNRVQNEALSNEPQHIEQNPETESGAARQLRAGAAPSVLVCMICLDTDSKMIPTTTHNLGEAYEKLTGYPLCDGGNLKQALCVQCAQQLRNFSRLREQSLRARSLMMELLEKHEIITIQHIKMIQHENNTLRNNLVSTTLGPDPCDMYVFENCNEDRHIGSEENVHGVAVKTEFSGDSQSVDESTQAINEEDPIKYESAVFMCTVCCEEFTHEHAYSDHVCTHLHDYASDNRAPDSDHSTNTDLKSCVVVLYDILKYPENAKIKLELLPQILEAVSSHDNAHGACEDAQYQAASEGEVAATHNEPAASVLSETEPGTSGHSSRTHTFTCNVSEHAFTRKDHLVTHMRSHTGDKPYSCDVCSYKCTQKCYLAMHMRTHTGERPYSCKICTQNYKQKGDLTRHMKTHTGEKPYSCDICGYQSSRKYDLIQHMKKHTSERPHSCIICNYKFKRKTHLVRHMSTHTGVKLYSCEICNVKFTLSNSLLRHNTRFHSGEKPYSCTICSYKSTQKSTLVHHMKTHTGKKP